MYDNGLSVHLKNRNEMAFSEFAGSDLYHR